MTTKNFFIALLIFIIGGAAGFFISYTMKPVPSRIVQLPPAPQVVEPNKFFEFFDTFTLSRDMGAVNIVFSYPDEHLIAFKYPTSQESVEFGVYDYKNDRIYKGIGTMGIGGGAEPKSFVGSDKLLFYTDIEDKTPVISIVDFNGKEIKQLLTGMKLNQAYGDPANSLILITEPPKKGKAENYMLDVKTLELKTYDIKG